MVALTGLSQAFGNTVNPQYLIPSQSQAAALSLLSEPPKDGCNIRVLIGEPGVGKTMLLLCLLEQFRASALTAHLLWSQLGRREFLSYFLRQLGVSHPAAGDVREAQNQLNAVFEQQLRRGRKVIVAVDEAHDLEIAALCELADVLDSRASRSQDLQVVLAGLPSLARKLTTRELRKLWDRVSEITSLSPLTPAESVAYIDGRLKLSGYQGEIPFTADAMATIAALAKGIPRNINTLCSAGLFLAAMRSRAQIDTSTVLEASAQWGVQPFTQETTQGGICLPAEGAVPEEGLVVEKTYRPVAQPASEAEPAQAIWANENGATVTEEIQVGGQETIGMADRIRQWFGDQRLSWSGTVGELATALDEAETEVRRALHADRATLRSFGIAVFVREPVERARSVSLRRIVTPRRATVEETSSVPSASEGMTSAPGCSDQVVERSPAGVREPANPAPAEPQQLCTPARIDAAGNQLVDLLPTNSLWHPKRRTSAWRRGLSALFLMFAVFAVGVGWTYGPRARPKVIRLLQELRGAKTSANEIVNGPTQPDRAANNPQALRAGGKSSVRSDDAPHLNTAAVENLRALRAFEQGRLNLATDGKALEQAVLSGDSKAQFELGTAYALGRGVPADPLTAYIWLTLAFVNGNQEAERWLRDLKRGITDSEIATIRWNLGEMYANGIGVRRDKITAYMWHVLAESAGEVRSSVAKSELASTMTDQEKLQAQLRATQWLKRHEE